MVTRAQEWRIAFISDPHGDLVALNKVVSDLKSAGPVDEVLIGGDLAQGGAQPAEVVDEIRSRGWPSVRGSGSNDPDPRPAYTIVTLGTTIVAEVRRVDWPPAQRLADYTAAGIELSEERRSSLERPGPFPVRSRPGSAVRLWP